MSPYALAVLSLTLAVLAQCITTVMATLVAMRPPYRRARMALAIGLALLATQEAFSLELALRTGLYDLRQSLLAAGVSLLLLFGLLGLRPKPAEMPLLRSRSSPAADRAPADECSPPG